MVIFNRDGRTYESIGLRPEQNNNNEDLLSDLML